MPRLSGSEEKYKGRSWLPLNKKYQGSVHNQRTRGLIKTLQSGA
jgi:hypothetical protein